MKEIDEGYINFNFDVSTYRLLGRELITDRITALFEIVKNSYDANADNVQVEFINVSPKCSSSKIIIKDDGIGMTLADLRTKWMVIGTSSKRRDRTSPEPYKRKVTGKKGVGRFAVDLLGAKLTLKTKKIGTDKWICLQTDWSQYSSLEHEQLTLPFEDEKEFFTDIKNKYWSQSAEENEKGTILEIENVNEEWTEYDIIRACRELSKLVSPNTIIPTEYPFNITLKSPYTGYENISIKPLSVIDSATIAIELKYDKSKNVQEVAFCQDGEIIKKEVPPRAFGFVSFSLYYFNQGDKTKFKKNTNAEIDGIKVYRDGLITTPFAETEVDPNKQKDILGIDKRRYSGFFDKVSTRDLMGFIELTDENNPSIIEATNRQDFLDNHEWRELKNFIIEQIEQIEKYLKSGRVKTVESNKSNLGRANEDLKDIKQAIASISREASPEVKQQLKSITSDLGKLQGTVNRSIKDYTKLEAESRQKEELFFSLVSLQTYAAMFSHMAKHTIGHVIRDAEYLKKHFPNESFNSRFKKIANRIYSEFITLRSGVDFMLKYAQSKDQIEDVNLHELLDYLFNNIYADIFREEQIQCQIDLNKTLILRYNKKALEDIFDNLISNSIKALKYTANKKIKCSGIVENNKLTLYFSDNGKGILEEDKHRIFNIFFTKTAEEGGAGIGLYMVSTRIESMQGQIEVVDNEFKPTGATFKIVLPFNKR